MDIHKKMKEIRQRWNMPEDSSFEENCKKFKTRLQNIFAAIDGHLSKESIAMFCNALGIEEKWEWGAGYQFSKNVVNAVMRENDPRKLYMILEIIFALDIDDEYSGLDKVKDRKDIYFTKVKDALIFSNIGVSIAIKNGDIILYPSGEDVLDQEIVNKVLSFLSGSAEQHFIDALKAYRQGNPKASVKSVESLRRAIEEFLKLKLENTKGLKANISELGTYLKKHTLNNDIRNIITMTIANLDHFFNENSKHEDGHIDEAENEYLIYQVALLLRYLHKT